MPCGITAQMGADDRKRLIDQCDQLSTSLQAAGVLVKGDFRDNYSPGWKFNHWELKVPTNSLHYFVYLEINVEIYIMSPWMCYVL